jgi:glycosyltransferase involved in cell wall biosynthesis
MRILYFSSRECWPLNTGARLRDYHFARQLARRAEVTYYGLRNPNDPQLVSIPAEAGLRDQAIVEKDESYSPAKLIKGLIGPVPVTLLNCENERALATLEKLLTETAFDSVQLEGVHLVDYVPVIRKVSPNAAIVGDWHNIESEIMRRYSQTTSGLARRLYAQRTAGLIEDMELRLLRACDVHTIASQRELERLRGREPKATLVAVGNGVDVEAHAPTEIAAAWNRMEPRERPAAGSVLFVGSMDYHANIDGAVEFARQIWPRFQEVERNSSAGDEREFVIVGRNPAPEVTALAAMRGIRITGTVPDVRGYYRGALAVAVPLRIGSGTRLKILEAMAAGVPVVSTRLGAEGLDVSHGKNILLAETPQEFVRALQDLSGGNSLREKVVEGARRLVASEYDWPLLGERLFEAHREAVRRLNSP